VGKSGCNGDNSSQARRRLRDQKDDDFVEISNEDYNNKIVQNLEQKQKENLYRKED
jgi:hypothetical protein